MRFHPLQGSLLDGLPTVSTATSSGERKKRRSVVDAMEYAADKVPLSAQVDQGAYLSLGSAQPRSEATASRHDTARLMQRLQVAFAALPSGSSGSPTGRLASPVTGGPRPDEARDSHHDDFSSVGALTGDSSLRKTDRAAPSANNSLGGAKATHKASGGPTSGQDGSAAPAAPLPGEAQMASEWQSAAGAERDALALACPHAQAIADARAAGRHLSSNLTAEAPAAPSSAEPVAADAGVPVHPHAVSEGLDAGAALAAAALPSLSVAAWAAQSEAMARAAFSFKHVDLCAAALADHVCECL